MPKFISHIKDNQVYIVEEDTIIEGSIGKNATIKVKNASLRIKGSVLEGATIKQEETKSNLVISADSPDSAYLIEISGNVSFRPGGGIFAGNRNGQGISVTGSDFARSKNTTLQIDGDVHSQVKIDWPYLIEVKGNVGNESHLTSRYDSIIAKNIGAKCIFNANKNISVANVKINCELTAGQTVNCGELGANIAVTSKYESIKTGSIGFLCKLTANTNITTQKIGMQSTLTAGQTISCHNVDPRTTLTSKYGDIVSKNIANGCTLNANRFITTENIGQHCALTAGQKIICHNVDKDSSVMSKYDSIDAKNILNDCELVQANKAIKALGIGARCTLIAGEIISAKFVQEKSRLTSKYQSIDIDGNVGSKAELSASTTIQAKSFAKDAILHARNIIDLSKPAASRETKSKPKDYDFIYQGNGTVTIERTPNYSAISIQGGDKPITIDRLVVRPTTAPTLLEEKKPVSTEDRRKRFLESYDRRKEKQPSNETSRVVGLGI